VNILSRKRGKEGGRKRREGVPFLPFLADLSRGFWREDFSKSMNKRQPFFRTYQLAFDTKKKTAPGEGVVSLDHGRLILRE
jgi:hypothetical protein